MDYLIDTGELQVVKYGDEDQTSHESGTRDADYGPPISGTPNIHLRRSSQNENGGFKADLLTVSDLYQTQ